MGGSRREKQHDDLCRAIIAEIRSVYKTDALAWHNEAGEGTPDIIVIFFGRFIGYEVKHTKSLYPNSRMSKAQKAFSKQCEAAGGRYRVVTCIADAMHDLENVVLS